MHYLVSILKIKILLFLKLFGTFFMKFLCNVELLIRSLTNLIMNSGGKWVKHPNPPYPLHSTHSKIPVKHLTFQETVYIPEFWPGGCPGFLWAQHKKNISFCTSWVKNAVLNLSKFICHPRGFNIKKNCWEGYALTPQL